MKPSDKKSNVDSRYWRVPPGYDNLYQVSKAGEVKNVKSGRLLKPQLDIDGYKRVMILRNGKRTFAKIARLVALSFLKNKNNKPEVNHKDGNKTNDCITNLEWVTAKENTAHALHNKLRKPKCGIEHANSKLTNMQVAEIKSVSNLIKHGDIIRLAKHYHVTRERIRSIIRDKAWKHIKPCKTPSNNALFILRGKKS